MKFRGSVKSGDSTNKNNDGIKDTDKKIDTEAVNDDQKDVQDKIEKSMLGEDDGEIKEDGEGDEEEEDDSLENKDSADTLGDDEEEDDSADVEDNGWNINPFQKSKEEDSKEGESDKSGEEDLKKGEEGQEKKEEKPETAFKTDDEFEKLSPVEKEKRYLKGFYEKHKDVLPSSFNEDFDKYYETGNDAFLHLNGDVHKLVSATKKLREDIPMNERLELAFKLAFEDKEARKRGEIDGEIKAQKVNKSASPTIGGADGKNFNKPKYSPAQERIMKKWGV